MRWQALIFDLDDTLYLERDYVLSGFRAVSGWLAEACKVDREVAYTQLVALFEQGVRGNTFDLLLEKLSLKRGDHLSALIRVYREHVPSIKPCPEVPGLLARLRKKCVLGLVTDGLSITQRHKLEALGLAQYFEALVISEELGGSICKPSPQPFVIALEKLGVDPENAVYVADNPIKDFLGARLAGLVSVRVRRRLGIYHDLMPMDEQHEPDLEVADLTNLEGVLAEL